ncbi:MAG: sensor histidine kinase, partial [Sphaerochaeta sp.]|nr:sensor histidine kinase [Sphaerochaeta sp.]
MHICIDDYLLDIVQNSFEAASSLVELVLDETESTLACLVRDNGKGMDAEVQKRVLDPFYSDGKKHAKRKVGLGLPFLS